MASKNEIFDVTIEGYASQGHGIARVDGMAVFVKGGIAGERLNIKLLKISKTSAYAKIEQILEASPHRQDSPCPYFGKCGGCDFHHMVYAEELDFKRRRVDDALRRIGGLEIKTAAITGAERTDCYRNKVQYPVAQLGGRARHGFFRTGSHDLVPVERCLIQPEHSGRIAAAVTGWMNLHHIPAYDETTGRGLIRHIYVRTAFGTGQVLACVIANGDTLPKVSHLIESLLDCCPGLEGIVLNVNRKRGNTVLGDAFKTLWGKQTIEERLCGLTFDVSPASFFQINRAQTEKLYARAIELAAPGPDAAILDLYCGAGTITLTAAGRARHVIGADIVPQAIGDAKKNAVKNGVDNARFILADAGQAAEQFAFEGLKPEIVIVDPPRKGLSAQVIEAVVQMRPSRMVYISCDPATLARDLSIFNEKGLTPVHAEALDMFPRCKHIESVVLLEGK